MINIYDKNEIDFTHNRLATLSNCKSCFIIQELNGGYSLEIEVVKDTKGKYKFIQPFNIIKADNQLFRIPTIENIQDTGITIKTYANQITYDLYADWIENTTITNAKVDQALQTIITNPKFTVIPTDITDVNSITLQSISPVQGVFNILDTWGGELYRDNFNIGIKQAIGTDNRVLVKNGKNILGFNQRIDTTNIVTRIIPIGKDNLTIETINNGVKYLDSPKINDYPYPIIREIKFENETDAESLMATALKLWGVIDTPEVNYTINFVELSRTEQYKDYAILETVNLGDQVIVRHSVFDVDIKLKVIKIKKDVLRNRIVEIELGSLKKSIDDYINSLQKELIQTKEETNDKIDETKENLENQIGDSEDRLKLDIQNTNEALTIIAQDFRNADNALDSKITISATNLTSDYTQKISSANGLIATNTSNITQNANAISSVVSHQGTQDGQISNAFTSITQNANAITSVATTQNSQGSAISSVQSSISQQASQISLVVSNGSINASSIMLAINNDYSYVKISADKVDLQGLVTITNLQNGSTIVNGACVTTGKVNMQYIGGDNIYFDSGGAINAMSGAIRLGYGNAYLSITGSGMTFYSGGYNVLDVSSGLFQWMGKNVTTS